MSDFYNKLLPIDFLRYASAFITQCEHLNKFRFHDNFGYISDFDEETREEYKKWNNKPIFNSNRHKWFSPELSKEEIALLSDPDYFTKEDLKDILNTLILNYINLEDLIDDQLGRTGTDNAAVSDTELQGRRDTYKEKEQGEIQCPEEENW